MIQPSDLLALARRLATDDDEAAQRAAISRAYYAAFLHLRARAGQRGQGQPPVSGAAHSWVEAAVSRWDTDAAVWLRVLRRERNRADYDINSDLDPGAAIYAVEIAEALHQL